MPVKILQLAREFSQDPGSVATGGDLGMVSRGMFDPAFDKALFGMRRGEISAPVRTQYGYHLIKLNKIALPEVPSFAALKAELEKQAREAKADELFAEAIDKLDTAVYEAPDLKEPAAKMGRSVQESPAFSRSGGRGIAAERKVVEAAFSEDLIKEGRNSQGIALADGTVAWVRVKQHVPAAVRPLAEVTADVRNQVLLEKAAAKAKSVAASVVKALGSGASLADVAARENLSWQSAPERRVARNCRCRILCAWPTACRIRQRERSVPTALVWALPLSWWPSAGSCRVCRLRRPSSRNCAMCSAKTAASRNLRTISAS